MQQVLAFDVYGTLINTDGLTRQLATVLGDRAPAFSKQWRERQLEYSFRRALMGDYVPFRVCTAQALEQTSQSFGVTFSADFIADLLAQYRRLPAYSDVIEGLGAAAKVGYRCVAFSNGDPESLDELLESAGLRTHLSAVISVDPVRSFKPDPKVYHYLLEQVQTPAGQTCMVSSNPFDVLGAAHAGLQTAWVARSPEAVFDPWGVKPTWQVGDLQQLVVTLGSGER